MLVDFAKHESPERTQERLSSLAKSPQESIASLARRSLDRYLGVVAMKDGKKSASFPVSDESGKALDLKKWRAKIILVDFWSASSVASLTRRDELKKLRAKYRRSQLEIISISLDSDPAGTRRVIAQMKLDWPQFFAKAEPLAEELGLTEIPAAWLLRADRTVATSSPGSLAEAIAKELK
jgi:peroxiredoxin